MSSPQVIDTAKNEAAIDAVMAEQTAEKRVRGEHEATEKRLAAVEGLDGSVPTASAEAQLGRPLSRQTIISRLTRLNPNLHFYQSMKVPEIGGVYYHDGISNLDSALYSGLRFIVGMEWTGISPEFTVRKVADDKWGVKQMVGQVRGWRTILARLIKERLITVEGAEREFQITRGRESQRWYEMLS